MSVPVIRYHASDDELEEFYVSTDDEKRLTPESERTSPKPSPKKFRVSICGDDGENLEASLDKRSSSVDENVSEGTPTPDRWKVLTEIKGKITKTFEDKLHEIKSEKKKSKHDKSRDTSSISDYEDLGDITPTEETSSEKQEKESTSPILKKRFSGFSYIKTGLKAKKREEDVSVESGVEAAEETYECQYKETDLDSLNDKNYSTQTKVINRFQHNVRHFLPEFFITPDMILSESDRLFIQLKNKIYYQLLILITILCGCYNIPVSKYFMGIWAGIFISVMVKKIYRNINRLIMMPAKSIVPVLEISAVEEHAILDKYEGWLNELPYNYEPDNYHVARTRPVFFVLEGETLHVMETRTRIPKRAIWDEPKHKPKYIKKRVYSVAGAKVELLPSGLIRRRYILNENLLAINILI